VPVTQFEMAIFQQGNLQFAMARIN